MQRTRGSPAGIVNLGTLRIVVVAGVVVEVEVSARRQLIDRARSRNEVLRSSSESLQVVKLKGNEVVSFKFRVVGNSCSLEESEIEHSALLPTLPTAIVADSMMMDSEAKEEMSVSSDHRCGIPSAFFSPFSLSTIASGRLKKLGHGAV